MSKLTAFVASLAALALALPAAAEQDVRDPVDLTGHWAGIITEQGLVPQYTLSAHINLDLSGDPVAIVEYDAFPCAGVWSNASFRDNRWTLQETITRGVPNCSEQVMVVLTPRADGALDVQLAPVGSDGPPATGRLQRRP